MKIISNAQERRSKSYHLAPATYTSITDFPIQAAQPVNRRSGIHEIIKQAKSNPHLSAFQHCQARRLRPTHQPVSLTVCQASVNRDIQPFQAINLMLKSKVKITWWKNNCFVGISRCNSMIRGLLNSMCGTATGIKTSHCSGLSLIPASLICQCSAHAYFVNSRQRRTKATNTRVNTSGFLLLHCSGPCHVPDHVIFSVARKKQHQLCLVHSWNTTSPKISETGKSSTRAEQIHTHRKL